MSVVLTRDGKTTVVRMALALLVTLLTAPHAGQSKALTFNSKTLESSSQLWSGFRHVLSPSFEDTNQNVTALVGDSAFLPCTVSHLGDRSVTWMRKRDLHILTAGIYTYSADERFRVLHPENSNDWTLHIKFATLRDSGLYECQVNSDPKISRPIILNVIEGQLDDPAPYETPAADIRFPDYKFENPEEERLNPRRKHKKNKGRGRARKVASVSIEGPSERHIQIGSVLAITCVVRHPPHEAPEHILWFHGPTNVDYDSARGGVSIQTEKSTRRTVSKLMLSAVSEADTGEYTCSPTNVQPAVLTVHVQDRPGGVGGGWGHEQKAVTAEAAAEAAAATTTRAMRLVCQFPPAVLIRGQLQQPVMQGPAAISRAATETVPFHNALFLLLLLSTLSSSFTCTHHWLA